MSSGPVVEMTGIGRAFEGPSTVLALDDVHLVIERGDYVSILGSSGSGKSTLLNLLGLLDRPTSGVYRLDGDDTSGWSEGRRAAARAQRIGLVFQSFQLLPQRTALENVMLSMLYSGVPRRQRRDQGRTALARVGLSHREDFVPGLLSGGERQRVAIARAIVNEPSLLLADEPTGNLDTANTSTVLDLFDELRDLGLTLAVITHDPTVSARARRRVRITDGRLAAA